MTEEKERDDVCKCMHEWTTRINGVTHFQPNECRIDFCEIHAEIEFLHFLKFRKKFNFGEISLGCHHKNERGREGEREGERERECQGQ